jgi:tetratricopeptide (TPR) repeat protein
LVLAGALGLIVVGGGIFLLLSGGAGKKTGLAQGLETIEKEGLSPATRSASAPGGMPVSPAGPSDETLARLRESFESQDYPEAVRLAEEILGQDWENTVAKDILNKAKAEITAVQVAPFLQSGIAGYNSGQYAQCIADMEKVLKIDKDNKDAQKYIFQADSALAKPEISALIERHRVAEENKDLLTVLSHLDSATLAEPQQAEYKMFFNGYDGIKSIISKVSITFSSRSSATVSFSQLLTAVYKKSGQRKIVFEGQKTWQMKKQGRDWKISAIR